MKSQTAKASCIRALTHVIEHAILVISEILVNASSRYI
jgi:hypothetical protein